MTLLLGGDRGFLGPADKPDRPKINDELRAQGEYWKRTPGLILQPLISYKQAHTPIHRSGYTHVDHKQTNE